MISKEFAIEVLTACYEINAKFDDHDARDSTIAQEVITLLGAKVMVPIYLAYPELGRVMQPAEWLPVSLASRKFGGRG
jgi:hypothetical protein